MLVTAFVRSKSRLVFDQILKNPTTARALIAAVKDNRISPAAFGPGDVARLRTHPNTRVTIEAAAVFAIANPPTPQKDELIAKLLADVQKPGDVAKGRALFAAACAVCHKLGDVGLRDVGPPLAGIGSHGAAELLTHIVDPNRQVEPNYWQWNITTKKGDTATGVIATIVQTSPIYVAFSIPQTALSDVREAIATGLGEVRATPQGSKRTAVGKIAVLDNTIDAATGTIMVRAMFENADDILWPGQLCNVRVTLRTDPDVVSVPRSATQSGQLGNFVYIVENNIARSRKVNVGRFQDGRDVILEGLTGGETVVSDGALLLIDGSRVDIRTQTNEKKGAI
jgi:putative heme-binding domain-containing protein